MANNPRNRDNLRPPWKKGDVPNPNGRPKGAKSITTHLREYMDAIYKLKYNPLTMAKNEKMPVSQALALRRLLKALGGSEKSLEVIENRMDGPLTQKIALGGGTKPLMVMTDDVDMPLPELLKHLKTLDAMAEKQENPPDAGNAGTEPGPPQP